MHAEVIDINNWNVLGWLGTTGTREKCFVENPADYKLYFFKESIEKFPSEFWSEIIASKFGQMLGFNMLDYNIALYKEKAGCICENMIDSENQEMIHGVNLVKKAIKGFTVTERPPISFQQVVLALRPYGGFLDEFIEIMIFDSLIGNQDRHSENWAIIRSLDTSFLEQNKNRFLKYIIDVYRKVYFNAKQKIPFKRFHLKDSMKQVLKNPVC